jgi:hypothetical protein
MSKWTEKYPEIFNKNKNYGNINNLSSANFKNMYPKEYAKMLEIIKKKPYMNNQEDEYFSLKLPPTLSYHVPSFDLAKQFSVETIFYDKPFGIHNCWKYLSPSDMNVLVHAYPEVATLMELQS